MREKLSDPQMNTFNLLIVDDDQDVLDLIYDVLLSENYNIDTEIDPNVALKKIESNDYDIIITDLIMPGLDGMQLINAAKEKNNDCRAIVITGHATVNTAIQALQLGVFDYVNKPVNQAEIKNLVLRATENLALSRSNQILQNRNDRILSHLSLLIDISKILYQVNDLNHAFDMVLDTLTDYFELQKCAILKEDIETGVFEIRSARSISKALLDLKFKAAQKINDTTISRDKETIVTIQNELLVISDRQYNCENGKIIFSPVSFQDIVLGYLIIQVTDEKMPSREVLTMIGILALQIAPLMNACNKNKEKPNPQTSISYLIRERIEMARDLLSPISFALLRPDFYSPSGDAFAYKSLAYSLHEYISKNISEEFIIYWQAKDTALLIMPEMDYFKAETFCKNLKNLTENSYQPDESGARVVLNFSCLGYPEGGNTAKDITDHLWAKLFQEIKFSEKENVIAN